ncbi:MAG: hypothetical protein DCC49_12980 [Acidobacteria bacterium]|nr:MAG: hypothetical protein DCC49_12980 [Acidobacteriota bacterium]
MPTTPATFTTTRAANGRTPAQRQHATPGRPRDSRPRPYSHRAPAPTRPFSLLSLRPVRDTLVGEEDMTGTVREYLYAGGEAPTAMRSRNGDGSYSNYFFATNTHGDVVALTDKDGNIVNRYAYGPWGEATRVSEQVHQPFRYAGYRYEDGFDLYYLRARWYDAGTGRFLSRDPYRGDNFLVPSLNRYVYAQSVPPTMKDPTGLSPSKPRRPFSWRNLGSCPGSNLPLRGNGNSLRRWLQSQYYGVDIITLRIDFADSPGGGNNLGYAERGGAWWGGSAINKVELRDDVDLCDSSEPPPVKPSLYVLLHELAHFEAFSGGNRQSCNIGTAINIESRSDDPDEMYASCRGLQVLKTYNATLDFESYSAGFEPSPPGIMARSA